MPKRILLSLIVSAFFLCCTAVAQTASQYSSSSIADFTIHKITPKKTIPVKNLTPQDETKTNNTKKSAVQPITTATKKSPFTIVKKTIQKADKPASKPETIHQKKPVTNHGAKLSAAKTMVHQQKPAPKPTHAVKKAPAPKKHNKKTVVKHHDLKQEEKILSKEVTKHQVSSESKNQKTESKDNYVEKLNKYLADDDIASSSKEVSRPKTLDGYDYFVKPSISLAIVLLLMLMLAWIYSKMKGINPNPSLFGKFGDSSINKFNILATSTLGQGKVIQLVEINGKQLVVGSTNQNINLLTEISPEEMEDLMAKAETKKGKKRQINSTPDQDYSDPDNYSARYSDLYREYTDKDDK